MQQEELDKIIKKHQHFLKQDCKGWEKMKADLSDTYLDSLVFKDNDLSHAVLDRARLTHCIIENCNISHASMVEADLGYSKITSTKFVDTNLTKASLSDAQLYDVQFSSADLSYARFEWSHAPFCNFINAKLYEARLNSTYFKSSVFNLADMAFCHLANCCLRECEFVKANLSYAFIYGADLTFARFDKTDLTEVKHDHGTQGFALACPEKGAFTAFKKIFSKPKKSLWAKDNEALIVELRVPAKALRSSATSRKCRVSEAKVVSITSLDGKRKFDVGYSAHNIHFEYHKGQTVVPNKFDMNRWKQCAPGIHCFITRDEAVQYTDF